MYAHPAKAGLCLSLPQRSNGRALGLLLQFEAWLDARSSARALYAMNDRALADMGLSRSDAERVNADAGRATDAD